MSDDILNKIIQKNVEISKILRVLRDISVQNNFDIEQDRVYSILTAQKKVLDDILEEVA